MSTDKHQNKSFGFRISSIFNQHSHSHTSQTASQPNKEKSPHKPKPSVPISQTPGSLPTPTGSSSASHPPQNTPRTKVTGASIASDTPKQPLTRNPTAPQPSSPESQISGNGSHRSPSRRKPPSGDFENLYFHSPNIVKTSPSPSPSSPSFQQSPSSNDTVQYNLGGFGNEVDSFLRLDSVEPDSHNDQRHADSDVNEYYDTEKSLPRSSPIMGLADVTSDSTSLEQRHSEESNDSQQNLGMQGKLPYPLEMNTSEISSPIDPKFEIGSASHLQANRLDTSKSPSPFEVSESASRSFSPSLDNLSIGSLDMFNTRRLPDQQAQSQLPQYYNQQQQRQPAPFPMSRQSTGVIFPRSPTKISQPPQFPRHASEPANVGLAKAGSTKTFYTSSYGSKYLHNRQSSSVSSLWSSNSSRNVNLATLKKSMNLKPGEGERSYYVLSIRRSSGTSYNETGPSKWKLPVGILPVDKSALYDNSNGRYLRLGGASTSAYRKKTSGVELKHGHLKPRLLAAEIDEYDDNTSLGLVSSTNLAVNGTQFNSSTISNKSSDSSKNTSRENSLGRTVTEVSSKSGGGAGGSGGGSGGDNQSFTGTLLSARSTRSDSIGSPSSPESLSDKIDAGYYQHRGYKYGKDGKDSIFDDDVEYDENRLDEVGNYNGMILQDSSDLEESEEPRLVLANPDTDSDSD